MTFESPKSSQVLDQSKVKNRTPHTKHPLTRNDTLNCEPSPIGHNTSERMIGVIMAPTVQVDRNFTLS